MTRNIAHNALTLSVSRMPAVPCDRLSARSCCARGIKVALSVQVRVRNSRGVTPTGPMKAIREMGLAGEADFRCDLAHRHLAR